MPDIEYRLYRPPDSRSRAAVSPANAPGASGRPSLSALLAGILARFADAARERIAEIVDAEIQYEESDTRYVHCDVCLELHPEGTRCTERAIGYCVECDHRRVLQRLRCSKCGSRQVTGVELRWVVTEGRR